MIAEIENIFYYLNSCNVFIVYAHNKKIIHGVPSQSRFDYGCFKSSIIKNHVRIFFNINWNQNRLTNSINLYLKLK